MFQLDAVVSAILGILFAVLGTITVFLMYWLWGFPFDKATRTSAAPKGLMILHRVIGFLFVGLYIFMMLQMAPRLIRYQVEFPPRTVVHICLGITIGFLLLIKVSIIRFFRHLEEWMPFLGTGILLCTYLLLALSVPFSFRERALARRASGGETFSAANLARIEKQLPNAGFPPEAPLAELSKKESLVAGRQTLLTKCVGCHDLRTILTRPRTPQEWVKVVDRMSEKPVLGDAITEQEQWKVAAYLVAISPELQSSAKSAREQKAAQNAAKQGAKEAEAKDAPAGSAFAPAEFKPTFEKLCTGCHELDDVQKHAWKDPGEPKKIMQRMLDNGLEASPQELRSCEKYLEVVYAKGEAK